MSMQIRAIRGMNDILPSETPLWREFEARVEAWLERHGYRNIRMPLVEPTQLFRRAIGEATDIVEKEMYSWRDELNDEELTLRPEGTASCVRAAIEHSLVYDGPKRLWYAGPMYRHERPQKGRYRQFHQYVVEALGYSGPDIDAEHIAMCAALWRELGLDGIRLELNTIGAPEERARYRADLVRHLQKHEAELDADAKRRLHTNPLRTLDSKNPMVQQVVASAPSLMEYLGDASRFEAYLTALGYELRRRGVTVVMTYEMEGPLGTAAAPPEESISALTDGIRTRVSRSRRTEGITSRTAARISSTVPSMCACWICAPGFILLP